MSNSSSIPSLKRPRSMSDPPSPDSTSSPKRAPSEDAFPSSSDSHLLSASMPGGGINGNGGPGSSPLRVDVDDDETLSDGDKESNGWVKRTEDVHLADSLPEGDVTITQEDSEDRSEAYKAQYNELLGLLPPPFKTWDTYYVVPASLRKTLQTLALDPTSKDAKPEDLSVDLLPLIKTGNVSQADPSVPSPIVPPLKSGQGVWHIETNNGPDGQLVLTNQGIRKQFWIIKDGLEEDVDFMFVPEAGWKMLTERYKYIQGDEELPRFCLPGERIQMQPPVYHIYCVGSRPGDPAARIMATCPSETPMSIFASFLITVRDGETLVNEPMPDTPLRIWLVNPELAKQNNDALALSSLKTRFLPNEVVVGLQGTLVYDNTAKPNSPADPCATKNIDNGDVLVLEVGTKDALGNTKWSLDVTSEGAAAIKNPFVINMPPVPKAPPPLFATPAFFGGSGSSSVSSNAEASGSGMQTRSQSRGGSGKGKGLVGLQNLGNTCFMNSAVQCLSNTIELNDYFLSGVYRDELNRDNPLGMHGQVAEAFGNVIENLWASNTSSYPSFSPRQLKHTTSRFAPQFAGYGQHDTQEFIAFLLDGLHEDLNRIIKKPYIEKPDWKAGGKETELALLGKECWEGYKKRNDSVIVDLFQGQLQSTLVCPECHKESITMDPFMYLTVPLPIAQHREFKCWFVPKDPHSRALKMQILITQNASFGQVKEKIGSLMKCSAANIVGFDLWKSLPYAWYADADHNGEAKENDYPVFYELAQPVTSIRKAIGTPASSELITVPVYTFYRPEHKYSRHNDNPSECHLQPFFITLSKAEASDPVAVRDAISKGYERFIEPDMRSQLWVPQGSSKAASHLPVVYPEEEERSHSPVTEIHVDGEQTRIVEATSSKSDSMDVDPSSGHDHLVVPIAADNASVHSTNSISSAKSDTKQHDTHGPGPKHTGPIVPRGDLYKVHVSEAPPESSGFASMIPFNKSKDPTIIPFCKGNISNASNGWSLLEHRKKSSKRNVLNRLTSGFNSIVNPSYDSGDEASPPATPSSPPLVVKPGEGIFCEWSVKKFQNFFGHVVVGEGMESFVDPAIQKERNKKLEGRAISIEDCLDEFSKEETLGQDDLWYCPVCKKHQAATKKLEIYKAPDILVICIKRFGSSRRLSDKLDNLVNFPIDGLDLEDRIGERKIAKTLNLSDEDAMKYGIESMGESMVYDLYAVDNHFGGLGGGHYTAFCRNREDNHWYNYDDSRVSQASESAVQSRAAYLLFYRRRAARPIGGLSRIKAEEASRAASRVVTPEPPSSPPGPSKLNLVVSSSRSSPSLDPSSLSDPSDSLPAYSPSGPVSPISRSGSTSPPMPSPRVSDSGADSDIETTNIRLGGVASSIGFGNSMNWGTSSAVTTTDTATDSIQHPFGLSTSDTGPSFPGTATTTATAQLPSPPESDDGKGVVASTQKSVENTSSSTATTDHTATTTDTEDTVMKES